MDLTNEQWAVLKALITVQQRRPGGHGCPWKPAQGVLNGILWIMRIGV